MSKYRFIKDSSGNRPRNISREDYISASYGDVFEYEPVDNPLKIYHFSGSVTGTEEYNLLRSLKNTINYYNAQDDLYNYDNFYNKPTSLYAFNSLHVGSGFEKGSVKLNFYISGSITASCSDSKQDGILYDLYDNKVGLILYREGFILINNTSSLSEDAVDFSSNYTTFTDNPRWIHAFISATDSIYFDIEYLTKNEVSTNTFFVYADKNQLNHSNNITYLETGSFEKSRNNHHYIESSTIQVKKTNKSPFVSGSATFEKQTFITNIGLYDKDKNLIGVGSLATPVRKTENREFLFKLRIDT